MYQTRSVIGIINSCKDTSRQRVVCDSFGLVPAFITLANTDMNGILDFQSASNRRTETGSDPV